MTKKLPNDKHIISTLRDTTSIWTTDDTRQILRAERAVKHCTIPSNLNDGSAMSIISLELAIKLNLPLIHIKEGITITRTKLSTFAYLQIRLNNDTNWRVIILCAVMDNNSMPLLIGSNDMIAYSMTPIPHSRTTVIGDHTKPINQLNHAQMMPFEDWTYAIRYFGEQQPIRQKINEDIFEAIRNTNRKIKSLNNENLKECRQRFRSKENIYRNGMAIRSTTFEHEQENRVTTMERQLGTTQPKEFNKREFDKTIYPGKTTTMNKSLTDCTLTTCA